MTLRWPRGICSSSLRCWRKRARTLRAFSKKDCRAWPVSISVPKMPGRKVLVRIFPSAIQELQSSVGSLKRERDEGNLRLKERERELTETRREVNSVIEKKKRLEQVSHIVASLIN